MRVYVVPVKSSAKWQLRWKEDGRWRQKSSGTSKKREAERIAARMESELEQAAQLRKTGWESVRGRFEDEHCKMLQKSSRRAYSVALNRFEELVAPFTTDDITSEALVEFVSESMACGNAPNTVKRNVRHLNVFFGWLVEQGLIHKKPKAAIPKASRDAKGRPLSVEEFERMLQAINIRCGEHAASWRFDAHVLWYSGLRIDEAYQLRWEGGVEISIRGINRHQPMLWCPANDDKSTRESLTPLTPDLVEYLRNERTPEQREGYVLGFKSESGTRLTLSTVSKRFAAFGKLAKVVTGRSHQGNPVYASAHDFRRSFATRWASEVEAAVLQQMMRHESITTTLKYYAFVNATTLGDKINEAYRKKANQVVKEQRGEAL